MNADDKPNNGSSPRNVMAGQFYRIARVYERMCDAEDDDGTIALTWQAERTPVPRAPSEPLSLEVDALWPVRIMPSAALRPRAGHTADASMPSRGSLFVTLFGVSQDEIRKSVRRIEERFRGSRSLRPIFLTDASDTSVFRHAGFTFEYFAPDIFGAEDQAAAFEQRFKTLWRKWNGVMLIDFSAPHYLARRLEDYEDYIKRDLVPEDRYDPRLPKIPARPKPVTDVVSLKADYRASGLDAQPDTFVLYRILGSDLPPRHEVGQTLANLTFMLDHEPELENCEKRWVLNRIVDPDQEAALIALLEERDQTYLRIPFDLAAYGRVGWDLLSFPDDAFFLRGRYGDMSSYDQARAQAHLRRFKNNYVINNNGARNAALRDGRERAKWVLPWDGNCFLTEKAWSEIQEAVRTRPFLRYFTVPMARASDNADLLDPSFTPVSDSEPQILFRSDAEEEFSEDHYYGRRPKVELFYRLGIPGPWDGFYDDVWDHPRPDLSPDAGASGTAGWVARLFSGQKALETEDKSVMRARGEARVEAITNMLDRLDVEAMSLVYASEHLTCYDEGAIEKLRDALEGTAEDTLRSRLIFEADRALACGAYSVTDKVAAAPSGDPHDYFHPAPYRWPNPNTSDGYPYVSRDGRRVPGTRLYEPDSDRYDRTRLQLMLDDTTSLALAWRLTGQDDYAQHAARLIRTWFIDAETRMAPHLTYAQVLGRWPNDTGANWGLIEMKDLYYFLDAVRLIERSGALNDVDQTALREWLRAYLEWLQTSEQGVAERLTKNNHGTCYDLQTASIAAFLGDAALLEKTFLTSRERILEQFTATGEQPHEMTRTQTAHYCCFNLQCWANLATLAQACGHDLWSFEGTDGRGLARGLSWLLSHLDANDWPYEQIEPFGWARFLPLFFSARDASAEGSVSLSSTNPYACEPLFFAHDGIKPYWMLGQRPIRQDTTPAWSELSRCVDGLEQAVFAWASAEGSSPASRSVDALEHCLWSGFSQSAADDLSVISNSDDASVEAKTAATMALSRWAFFQGDVAKALSLAETLPSITAGEKQQEAMLRALGLMADGQVEAAQTTIDQHLQKFPNDADFCLLMANLERRSNADDVAWTARLNRVYRQSGLSGALEAKNGAVGWRLSGPTDADRSQQSETVTVVLTPAPGTSGIDASLASIQSQTWRNLEILIVDRSADAEVGQELRACAVSDPRIKILARPYETSDSAARNGALAEATGDYVVRLDPNESAHPMKIELQLRELQRPGVAASLARHVRMTPDGEALATWSHTLELMQDNPASLMMPAQTLRDIGGWDEFECDTDTLLLDRLRHSKTEFGDIRVACPNVPLSLTLVTDQSPTPMPPARERAMMQAARWQLDHRLSTCDAEQIRSTNGHSSDWQPDARSRVIYVGDFSPGAPGLETVLGIIEADIADGPGVRLLHWPDYAGDATATPERRILDMIEKGQAQWVFPQDSMHAERLILCHTHVVGHKFEWRPEIAADRIEVLVGPQMRPKVFSDFRGSEVIQLPEIQAIFGQPARFRPV